MKQRFANHCYSNHWLRHYQLAFQSDDAKAELPKPTVPAGVGGEPALMIGPIDLHDEASLWSKEVHDQVVDDDLP